MIATTIALFVFKAPNIAIFVFSEISKKLDAPRGNRGNSGNSQTELSYENDELKLFVVKAAHLQEKKFKLQDHMFHLKLENKQNGKMPLLSNILKFLHVAFLFILNNIKKFYEPANSHIAFMTLIQSPMLNAVNSGGFLLHDETSPSEMVDRLLALLNQYLVSHKSLELNKTFKVYLKILSADHSKILKANKKPVKKQKLTAISTMVGCSEIVPYKALWAIDVPQLENLENACLLLTTAMALAQHKYFESNLRDKKFKYFEKIISSNHKKFKYAKSVLIKDIEIMCNETGISIQSQPYQLLPTIAKLSTFYKVQFFIFEGTVKSTNKMYLRYPKDYDCSLKPIFLYKPCNTNHLVFIRNLMSYYKANGKTCFVCKTFYKTAYYSHFCKASNNCCFICHRYLLKPTTYVNSSLNKFFCDSKLNRNLNEKCQLCNVLLYSESCKKAHRLLCHSKGFFGYFCDLCKKFTYASSGIKSDILKQKHRCFIKTCKLCFEPMEPDHLCKLKLEKYPRFHSNLCFIHFEIVNQEPLACVLLQQNGQCYFENQLIVEKALQLKHFFNPDHLTFTALNKFKLEGSIAKKCKKSRDLSYIEDLVIKMDDSFEKEFLMFVFEEKTQGTTFIVSDEDNISMVSTNYCPN